MVMMSGLLQLRAQKFSAASWVLNVEYSAPPKLHTCSWYFSHD